MKSITLISDTHSHLDEDILQHCREADEVWHGGDLGQIEILKPLKEASKVLRGVYGNIDQRDVREEWPLNLEFECEGVKVFMTHIGGYPGRYTGRVKKILQKSLPNLYICGHSHICKVMPDKDLQILHMNPGACGHEGFHSIRTILRFDVADGKITNLRAIELGKRGHISSQA